LNAPATTAAVIDRSGFIGGSDAAAILKVSPWSTPLDVFLEKTGQAEKIDDPKREKLFKRGKRLEPIVINMLIEDEGVKVTKRSTSAEPNRYVDKEYPFLAAEIDFEWEVTADLAELLDLDAALVGTIQNGEAKTVHVFASAKFGEEREDVPIEYAGQALHGLMVTGRQVCLFGVLFGADKLGLYLVKRDDATIKVMRATEVKFWNEHVLAGVPPEPVNLPDVTKLLERREKIVVEASADAVIWLGDLESAKTQKRIAEEMIEAAKFELGKFMLGEAAIVRPVGPRGGMKPVEPTALAKPIAHELTINTEPALVINLQRQRRLDSDKVKKEHPEVAEACSYDLKFFKFDPPRKKAKR
jgi:predicted phage-related endonuclease